MKIMRLYIPLVTLVLLAATASAQNKKSIEFVGGARSFMSNNQINVHDSLPDSTTIKRNTGGYALIDLGVDIRPNKSTEILGMFRIRNNYGGFWGAGVTFDVRQLWLKGVIGNVVRYQVGDLNLKQTQFTLYNHQADRIDSMPAVFRLQSDIVAYENFYQKNTWRQQGASVDFGLKFAKYVQAMDFTGYLVRLQASNFTSVPDRLMGGFSVNLTQSKYLKIGYNGFYVFEVRGTSTTQNSYSNSVNTINLSSGFDIKNNRLDLRAEMGRSVENSVQDLGSSSLDDYFVYGYAKFTMPAPHLEFTAGYLYTGPDFRSLGAQTKNINYDAATNYYSRYTNAQTTRPTDLMDQVSNYNLYLPSVKQGLMSINPVYNNIMPYGLATFNRNGGFVKAAYRPINGIVVSAEHYNLGEVRGQGTFQLKQFTQSKLLANIELNKLLGWKRLCKIQLGINYQTTERSSDVVVERVDLKTTQYQAGFELEVLPKIDVLGGILGISAKGNEFLAERNSFSQVDYFTNTQYDLNQRLVAFGARCRFSDRIYLMAMYQTSHYEDKLKKVADFDINQFSLIYNMTF